MLKFFLWIPFLFLLSSSIAFAQEPFEFSPAVEEQDASLIKMEDQVLQNISGRGAKGGSPHWPANGEHQVILWDEARSKVLEFNMATGNQNQQLNQLITQRTP